MNNQSAETILRLIYHWHCSADDKELYVHGELPSLSELMYMIASVLILEQVTFQQQNFEKFARAHLRKDGPFLRDCNLIDTEFTYADPDIEAAWQDWKGLASV